MKKISTILLTLTICVSVCQAQSRQVTPFNDEWQFKRGPLTTNPILATSWWNGQWEQVEIPHTWNAQDMLIKSNAFYAGAALYRRSFIPTTEKNRRTFLRFEGVGSVSELYVNGIFVGRHEGGYSAFCFEITPLLKHGIENQIVLMADNSSREDVIPVNHNLFGVYGGIYRPVWLITTDQIAITPLDNASSGVYVNQKNINTKSAQISIEARIDNALKRSAKIEFENTIYDMTGRKVTSSRRPITLLAQGLQRITDNFTIKNPHLWNGRQDPYLYRVETKIYRDGQLTDQIISPLGIRQIEIIAGKGVYLNGEKYPMYGVCRHQDRMGYGSALSNANHAQDLDMIMEIGATTVRFAHYQQSDYIYSKCDSLGLLIWAEIPLVNRITTKEANNAKSQLTEMILQSYNHPSLYVWGLHNEVYTPTHYTAALTRELHMLAKTLDPYRYTVSVNGYGTMDHPVNLQAEIQGMNRYFGWYEGKIQDMIPWVEGLEKNYPDVKLMLTEYGADANTEHQSEQTGQSYNWGSNFYPEGFATKTHEQHWGIISNHPYILASYVWNMFDFAAPMWDRGGVPARNMKGLVTFDRRLRKDSFFWYKANWSKEPVFYLTDRRASKRENQQCRITLYSNIGQPDITLNGRQIQNIKTGETAVHYIADSVQLDKGKNLIIATAPNRVTRDTITWYFTENSKTKTIGEIERQGMHVGF